MRTAVKRVNMTPRYMRYVLRMIIKKINHSVVRRLGTLTISERQPACISKVTPLRCNNYVTVTV